MKLIFFGTPPFAADILEFLFKKKQHIVAIVTRPDRPRGRSSKLQPSAVKALALEQCPKIPLFQPEKASTPEFVEILKAFETDVFIVAAYGEIIKTNLLELPKKECINVHASLLPKYRGAAPIQRAIIEGEKETGVTIMEMVLKMDAGAMLKQVKTPIDENMTYGELEKKLCQLSKPALLEVLQQTEANTLEKIPQDETHVTYAPKILNEDRIIDWKRSAEEIHDQIRGLSPFPGAYCMVDIGSQPKRLIIKRSKKEDALRGSPGQTLVYDKNQWIIACGERALSLLEIQLEGKKTLTIQQFFQGIPNPPNFIV